jgi:hypothetical protein
MPLIVPAVGHLRAVLINNNAEKTNDPIVDLILSAQGATLMLLSNNEDFVGAVWEPYVTAKEWILDDDQVGPGFGDGEKAVYVKFSSGLVESSIYTAIIILDTTPPIVGAIPILINEGDLEVTTRDVILTFNVLGATVVELFNESELENTQGTILPYNNTIFWRLSKNNGRKTVLVVFIDDAGNRSSFFSATTILTNQAVGFPSAIALSDATTDHFITLNGTGDPEAIIQVLIDGYGGEGYGYGYGYG